jgi:hypothetical protein
MIAGAPVHTRRIEMSTHVVDEKSIIVEGILSDKRHQAVYDLSGEKKAAGPIHHIVLRLLVNTDTKKILDAEADMLHVPHEQCSEALESLSSVKGLRVERGFNKQVAQRIGGIKGCAHLTHLMIVMAQEVFQGSVVVQRQDKSSLPKTLADVSGIENLVGSCKMWKPGGLKLERLSKVMPAGDLTTR